MNRTHLLALVSAALLICSPALAAAPNSSVSGKDASGATVTMGAVSDGTLKSPTHGLVTAAGAIVNPASSDNQTSELTKLDSLISAASGPIPAGTATIGATYGFQNSTGNTLPPAADASAAINVSTATTTQIVALSSGKKIYVGALDVIAGGAGNITFVYGTGSNCGTGTTSLTGAYNLTAQAGLAKGNGLGAVLVVPASNALCVTTSAAVQMSGSVSYTQF